MKKTLFLLLSVLLISSFESCADNSFSSRISKVPITNLPIGDNKLYNRSTVDYDYKHPNRFNNNLGCDSLNSYGLNNLFRFDSLTIINKENILRHSLLSKSGEMIFVKRLPPVGSNEILIYYVNRTWEQETMNFPIWLLLVVNPQGAVVNSMVVSGVDFKEMDCVTNILFNIDNNYIVTLKAYRTKGGEEDMEEDYDPSLLYEYLKKEYKISESGINIIE